jgi:hypothetical protein
VPARAARRARARRPRPRHLSGAALRLRPPQGSQPRHFRTDGAIGASAALCACSHAARRVRARMYLRRRARAPAKSSRRAAPRLASRAAPPVGGRGRIGAVAGGGARSSAEPTSACMRSISRACRSAARSLALSAARVSAVEAASCASAWRSAASRCAASSARSAICACKQTNKQRNK